MRCDITHVVDKRDLLVHKVSVDSWQDKRSGHYLEGRPCHRRATRCTGWVPDHPQVGNLSEAVAGGHRRGMEVAERLVKDQLEGDLQPVAGLPERQHAPDPQPPCADSLLPSCEPSILFEFP